MQSTSSNVNTTTFTPNQGGKDEFSNPTYLNKPCNTEFWCKSFDNCDHKKDFEHGNNWMKLLKLPTNQSVVLVHLEPPFGINLCNQFHFGYMIEGNTKITMSFDKQTELLKKGDIFYIPRDHESVVEGESNCVALYVVDFLPESEFSNLKLCKRSIVQKLLKGPMEETRELNNMTLNNIKLTDKASMSYVTIKPGWKWSKDIKPTVNTDLCEHTHILYGLAGELIIVIKGKEHKIKAGDLAFIPCNHDAYVEGNTDFVALQMDNMASYGQAKA